MNTQLAEADTPSEISSDFGGNEIRGVGFLDAEHAAKGVWAEGKRIPRAERDTRGGMTIALRTCAHGSNTKPSQWGETKQRAGVGRATDTQQAKVEHLLVEEVIDWDGVTTDEVNSVFSMVPGDATPARSEERSEHER
ncbi:hypothetical protein FIBSPDRAFT_901971 [Athelia psychrophila]|uniref:Uncharacterized protein n=1 Tax=Athelia psychrophila TaxID=1759441 RepID=A0A165WBG1_9AGAM|nr:hypothetical protein FIBSPDRAFT_901971 [Fibularhizoctonia sp. CBS 109695]